MVDLAALLRCPCNRGHKIWVDGRCWYCAKDKGLLPEMSDEAKAMRDRMRARQAMIESRRDYFDQEAENFYDGADERIWR